MASIHAVVFDLDGTLTATNEVDSRCYVEAFEAELGVSLDSDWSQYQHCTDEGIAIEAVARRFGQPPSQLQIERLKRRFVTLLGQAANSNPDLFRPIAGSHELLRSLVEAGWIVVVATGGWRESALLKLEAAGFPLSFAVFASDGVPSREEIVARAIEHARSRAGGPLASIVSVGDAAWDVEAAAALGLPFVGIGTGNARAALVDAGAQIVLDDYSDAAEVIRQLTSALPPRPTVVPGVAS